MKISKLFLKYMTIFFVLVFMSCSDEFTDNSQSEALPKSIATHSNVQVMNFYNYIVNNGVASTYLNDFSIVLSKSFIILEDEINIITLLVEDLNGNPKGVIYGIENNSSHESFPLFNGYAIVYDSFVNYNFSNKSGNILSYDWNYGNLFQQSEYLNNDLINYSAVDYSTMRLTPATPELVESACAGGSNGNVSWGECMTCLRGACSMLDACQSMSDLLDAISDAFSAANSMFGFYNSTTSMGAACIVIASIY
ncbi:MAG: hypothetical protein RQ756_00060 [Flavobacteriaceae bacterium]|nr:hypothetical protein [Flavobacteriaceae bacterium]